MKSLKHRRGTALSTTWATSPAYVKQNGGGGGRDVSEYDGVPHSTLDAVRRGQDGFRFATWNVGSMSCRNGEVAEVLHNRRVDICCVQETRWKGGSARMLGMEGRRYKFFWQGCDAGLAGVGVLLAEKWIDKVVNLVRVNERILLLRLLIGKRLVTIVSSYAPQVGRSTKEKDIFWDQLTMALPGLDQSEIIVVGGDLNGHVSKDTDGFSGVHGGRVNGTRNAEGERVLEFADSMDMAICNTFDKGDAKLVTNGSGGHRSQIDFFLVRKKDLRVVKDVKVIPGEECVS